MKKIILGVICGLSLVAACGQKGGLYLPALALPASSTSAPSIPPPMPTLTPASASTQ